MNKLKSEWSAEAAEAWIAKHRQEDGFVYNEDIFALFAKAETALSAQPSPDAAQGSDEIARSLAAPLSEPPPNSPRACQQLKRMGKNERP